MIFTATIFLAFCASGQTDTLFKQRVGKIVSEYSNSFRGFTGNQKLSGVPKQLFVHPGLQGGIDELRIWDDTLFIYSSIILEQGDSSSTRRKVEQLDVQLQSALGPQFAREVLNLSFSGEQEVPLSYKSRNIEVYVSVGKFKDKYMTLLAFKGHGQKE
jgi:hypothetical protein